MQTDVQTNGQVQRVSFTFEEADYQTRVNKALKNYAQKVSMPGFRKGQVPMGMVKKMYGKAMLAEELNQIVQESLNTYIKDNQLEILGQPLTATDSPKLDIEKDTTFTFVFELGLRPNFEVILPIEKNYPLYEIAADEESVENYIKDVRMRNYENQTPEVIAAGDSVSLQLFELDENGQKLNGGLVGVAMYKTEELADQAFAATLYGAKKEDIFTASPLQIFGNDQERMARTFRKEISDLEQLPATIGVKVLNIYRDGLAELNQALFDKVFGPLEVTSEADFRIRIKEELEVILKNEAPKRLLDEVMGDVFESHQFELPDSFMKKWLKEQSDKPLDEATLEQHYPEYAKKLRQDLIVEKILTTNNATITFETLLEQTKVLIKNHFEQYGMDLPEKEIEKQAMEYLRKEENYNQLYNKAKISALEQVIVSLVKTTPTPISLDEFKKLS